MVTERDIHIDVGRHRSVSSDGTGKNRSPSMQVTLLIGAVLGACLVTSLSTWVLLHGFDLIPDEAPLGPVLALVALVTMIAIALGAAAAWLILQGEPVRAEPAETPESTDPDSVTEETPRSATRKFLYFYKDLKETRSRLEELQGEHADYVSRCDELELDLRRSQHREKDLAAAFARLSADLEEFAYIASHDLKEPIRGIRSRTEFLLEDYAPQLGDEGKQQIDRLIELCDRTDSLLSRLRTYSRIKGPLEDLKQVDTQALAKDVFHDVIRSREKQTARKCELIFENDLPPLEAKYNHVEHVFSEIYANGLMFNESPRKQIRTGFLDYVELGGQPFEKLYFISDNGVGFDPKYHDEVFKLFRRLNRVDRFGATPGAGLTIARKVISLYGGTILCESEPGKGSTFYFSFEGKD